MIYDAIDALVSYAVSVGLMPAEETVYARNALLDAMGETDYVPGTPRTGSDALADVLGELTDEAVERGLLTDSAENRDIFDTKLMNCVTPRPAEVRRVFREKYAESPAQATDWYYKFALDSNYIRRDRLARDKRWVYESAFGALDVTINKAKPEKDPRDIAAAGKAKASGYPLCALCAENEGYAGRVGHAARANHRLIPLTLGGEPWALQYSPYVYYNEHCIVLSMAHRPMRITEQSFVRLLEFVTQFPHYFVGSNADLPIVGGSILSHDHFQGGHYEFAMAKAPVETPLVFKGFEDVEAGIVKWPMSVLRLTGPDSARIVDLADRILGCWRGYTDEAAVILAETDGVPHNTITPIARRRGASYQLDLVLRNNLTTDEHPLGLYHPHAPLHHIKKENIGLIEVMGLAVLPSRLKAELEELRAALIAGGDLRDTASLASHAAWAEALKKQYVFTAENAEAILRQEVGRVFLQVLCDAGVYKRDEAGKAAFLRFIDAVNAL